MDSSRIAVVGPLLPWILEESAYINADVVSMPLEDLVNPRSLDGFSGIMIIEEPQDIGGMVPRPLNQVFLSTLESFAERGGRVFAEACYPDYDTWQSRFAQCFGVFPEPVIRRCELERIALSANHPVAKFEPYTLLEEYRSFAIYCKPEEDVQVIANYGKYLGLYTASEPLPDETFPAITSKKLGVGEIIFATFPLSRFESLRYRPKHLWRKLAAGLVAWLAKLESRIVPEPKPPVVNHNISKEQRAGLLKDAVRKNIGWFRSAGLLPAPDGSKGVWEASNPDTREIRRQSRPDCNLETAVAFVLAGKLLGNEEITTIGSNIAKYMFEGGFQQMNPESPGYGGWNWLKPCDGERMTIFIDDNSWACICSLMLSKLLGQPWMAERGLLTADMLMRLKRRDGMIATCVTRQDDSAKPFGDFYEDTETSLAESPHFGGMGAAALAYAYLFSGRHEYLEQARFMTERIAARMPGFERVSRNCKSHAYARMLFPLAVLAKVDPSSRWIELAAQVDDYYREKQHESGAIYEWEHWETRGFRTDTGIFDKDGDTIADLLYTCNFALYNSWLAWKSIGSERHLETFEKLADFLAAIQDSSGDPMSHGGWFRGFDFGNQWDWFGCNHDISWGPYVMETGWTNAPISMAFSMYVLDFDPFEMKQ